MRDCSGKGVLQKLLNHMYIHYEFITETLKGVSLLDGEREGDEYSVAVIGLLK